MYGGTADGRAWAVGCCAWWQEVAHDDPGDRGCPPGRSGQPQFLAEQPNPLWVADFTYVVTWSGWVFVAFVIEVFTAALWAGESPVP